MGTTYRTYYITAESQEKAEEMAFEEVDADWEISKAWKRNAEISFSEEIEDAPKLSDEQMDELIGEVKKRKWD